MHLAAAGLTASGLYVHHDSGGGAEACPLTRGDLVEKGRDIVLFPGVEDWFPPGERFW